MSVESKLFIRSIIEVLSEEEAVKRLFYSATLENISVVCWKLPSTAETNLLIDFSKEMQISRLIEPSDVKGFILSPFLRPSKSHFLLQPHLYVSWNDGKLVEISVQEEILSSHKFFNFLKNIQLDRLKIQYPMGEIPNETDKNTHLKNVELAVEAMKKGPLQKVVLSRTKYVHSNTCNPVDLFFILKSAYPTAFVCAQSTAKLGTWACASPETLLEYTSNGLFRTVALAGTQARSNIEDLSEALWSQKEIEEQALVSRYIINCFKKIRLREFEEKGPYTMAAGPLIHLQTEFFVDVPSLDYPNLSSVMLDLLHPTSAVCGMPKELAESFITESEGYDRAMYAGFLGPVGYNSETRLFVHLRCVQFFEGLAVLYAGGGLTKDSKPLKEWEETEQKSQTLGKFLVNNNHE